MDKEGRHTAGPWEVRFSIATNPVAVVYADRRGDVAIIHRSSPTDHYAGIETVEAKANAKLIAAAPEMADLLREFIDWQATNADNTSRVIASELRTLAMRAEKLLTKIGQLP